MYYRSIKNDLQKFWLKDLPESKDKKDYIKYYRLMKLAEYKTEKIRRKIVKASFEQGAKYVYEYDGRTYQFEKLAMICLKKDGTKSANNHKYHISLRQINEFKKI